MQTYEWRRPLLPWWLVVLLIAAAVWILHGLYRDVFGNLVAMGPLIGLVGYVLAALLVNRTHVRVDAEGFRRSYGPIRLGPEGAPVPAARVKRVYVRWATASSRYGTHRYLAAGLETAEGRWLDATEPGETEDAVWAAAHAMAAALGGSVPVGGENRNGPGLDGPGMATVLAWFGGAGLAILWAIAVQLVRNVF